MKLAFIPSTFLPWVGGAEIQTHKTANKIIEAIAVGLPVFSFNTKRANEILVNNQNGFLIDKYEPLEMANFLMKKFN